MTEYEKRIMDYLCEVPIYMHDVAVRHGVNLAVVTLMSDPPDSEYRAAVCIIETVVFGNRVECSQCGSMVLPGLCCQGCGEWTAPERSE